MTVPMPHLSSEIRDEINSLKTEILEILSFLKNQEARSADLLNQVHPKHREGARNLLHYLALRQNNLENLQKRLTKLGLSSLGRSESHVLHSLGQIIERLDGDGRAATKAIVPKAAEKKLQTNTIQLFGPYSGRSKNHIIVTAPDSLESNVQLMDELIKNGMTCLRVNCAHGNESEWQRTIDLCKTSANRQRKNIRILMDLAGPKLRTKLNLLHSNTIHWKVSCSNSKKSDVGIKIRMASSLPRTNADPEEVVLVFPSQFLNKIRKGDQIFFRDGHNKKRTIEIKTASKGIALGTTSKTLRLNLNCKFSHIREDRIIGQCSNYRIQARDPFIEVSIGDTIDFVGTDKPKTERSPSKTRRKKSTDPQTIGCSIPLVLKYLKKGDRVLIDDGKIETVVEIPGTQRVRLKIIRAPKPKNKIKDHRGVNFPDTDIKIRGLTAEDKRNLPHVLAWSDIVALSFVNRHTDVRELIELIPSKLKNKLGLVLKIETNEGFKNLPLILFEAMKHENVGVMIARGDLAVEIGFERMAEVQEEILWLCEAAYLPAIWATQVLESLAKTGLPSRAEITDAAMSSRAEAVMLNKGPFIKEAVKSLVNILERMASHQKKKRSILRALKVSRALHYFDIGS